MKEVREDPCKWRLIHLGDAEYESDCGHLKEFFDGGPLDHGWCFCPWCGRMIVEEEIRAKFLMGDEWLEEHREELEDIFGLWLEGAVLVTITAEAEERYTIMIEVETKYHVLSGRWVGEEDYENKTQKLGEILGVDVSSAASFKLTLPEGESATLKVTRYLS